MTATSGGSRTFDRSSKSRLTAHDVGRFPADTLFDRIARAVCDAGCLPRKELFESWEVARRIRRRFRGGRIIDLCGGHGLLAHMLLLLDDSSPGAVVADSVIPPSAARLAQRLEEVWPRLRGRVSLLHASLEDVALGEHDLVVSIHACGGLTDRVIGSAVDAGARLAVLPCCHDLDTADTAGLTGWIDGPLAVDVARAAGLRARGWQVWTQTIPSAITPENRLLMAGPPGS